MTAKTWISYRENSRRDWGNSQQEADSTNNIQLGCLLRIADACEAMAQNYNKLLADVKWLSEQRKSLKKSNELLCRSNAALRGHIKRMKRAK